MQNLSGTNSPSALLSVIFFALYIAIAVSIGYIASLKEDDEEFMIAGRRVRGLQLMTTMSAGWSDGVTLAVFLAYVYKYGFSAILCLSEYP